MKENQGPIVNTENIKPRILVIDDSRMMRFSLKKILGNDYDVVEAEHGEDGWTLLTNDPSIQIVFTDLSMPYLNGYELLERIRESTDSRLCNLPVIIITGKEDDEEARQQALEKGANDFISKPFDSLRLRARAKSHIRLEQTTRKLTESTAKLETHLAIDEVTGLGNQHYFQKVTEETLSYIKRHEGKVVLVCMSIDNFNPIFIKHGKGASNNILKNIGSILTKHVRQEDKIARISLAKFTILLQSSTLEGAQKQADRIRHEIESTQFNSEDKLLHITASMGIVAPPSGEHCSYDELFAAADKCLSTAVNGGGNQIISTHFTKPLKEVDPVQTIDVGTALKKLAEGDTKSVIAHGNELIKQLLPLLEVLAKHSYSKLLPLIKALKNSDNNDNSNLDTRQKKFKRKSSG